MNTLRLFLLLTAVFFFAYLFQTNTLQKKELREDVLGEKTPQLMMISVTPFREIASDTIERISQYRYPGSILVARKDRVEYWSSDDDIERILRWYKQRLQLSEESNSEPNRGKNYHLSLFGKIEKVNVVIKKTAKSIDVSIALAVTAP